MLLGSHTAIGGEHNAGATLHIVGNIETASGCITRRRAGGVAAQVMAGDPVFQGDLIETAADGRVAIRFIEGTVLNLLGDACVVLNELAREPDAASNSALFRVLRGTFAFTPGRAARTNCLTIDTPVGSIQGWGRAGGIGMVSLAALAFSIIKEAEAAGPDGTYLDDDSITYKDLEHGRFELVTKEAVPRVIIVEDPGETVVLTTRGSSVSVNQVSNTPARMEELQTAQQEVLSNLTKGQGPSGSSTPPSVDAPPVQKINFNQSDTSPAALQSLEPIPVLNQALHELIVGKIPPAPPTLTAVTGPIEIDTVVFDQFNSTSGTLAASSANGPLTFGISGGAAVSAVMGGVTYNVAETGAFGTLYVNSTTGNYTFVPNSAAINALKTTATENFTVTVSDGVLSASQTVEMTFNGVNDAAVISGSAAGSVTEAGTGVTALSAAPVAAAPTVTGTLASADVDDPANTFTAVSTPTLSKGGYGTFTMTQDGVWTYALNNANSKVQALNVGDTLTDSFTVTSIDGTPETVTIIIGGANDAAIISGDTAGSVIEDSGFKHEKPTVTGTLTAADVDNPANTFTAVSSPVKGTGGYGTFTMTSGGTWVYKLDNDNCDVQALNVGDTLTDTFTVTSIDGTPQKVTITIEGTNDKAHIFGTTTGCVVEAGECEEGKPTATGKLYSVDIDNPDNTFTAVSSPTASKGGYGTFTMTQDGVWTYTLDDTNSAVQALNDCDTLIDTFTVTSIDGTPQTIKIVIDGTNDKAIVSGAKTGSVTETGGDGYGKSIASGTLIADDVDNPDTFIPVSYPRTSAGGYGTFTMTAAGVWVYKLDNDNCDVQALDFGDTLTDSFKVKTVDGTTQVVTITIHGANDGDPNDFDHLAAGSVVTADPPYILGTPRSDSIAAGSQGQIIYSGAGNDTVNGTGKYDLLYGGSSNDTIKGNAEDDTIYGGSGSDTINGSNGSDTIVGGYGADNLTGSNGDDRFVYLSTADSNADRHDTIFDFRSGSDKIDLTAFGALGFILLTSTGSSVPARTVAVYYDSTANQTVVYVNPTNQALDIGDTGLLEIHVQGIATIEASDFVTGSAEASAAVNPELVATTDIDAIVMAAAATDASSASAAGDGAVLDEGKGAAGPVDTRDSIDVAQDLTNSRFIRFEDSRTHSTEGKSATETAPAGGPSIQPVQVAALTEESSAPSQPQAFAGASSTKAGPEAAMSINSTNNNSIGAHNPVQHESGPQFSKNEQFSKNSKYSDDDDWSGSSDGKWKSSSEASSWNDGGQSESKWKKGGWESDGSKEAGSKADSPSGEFYFAKAAYSNFDSGETGKYGSGKSFYFKEEKFYAKDEKSYSKSEKSGFDDSNDIGFAKVDDLIDHGESAAGKQFGQFHQKQYWADGFGMGHGGNGGGAHWHDDLIA